MKMVKYITFENRHPNMTVNILGSAVVQALERRYPRLADEFLGLFSYASDDGMISIAAVGSEFRIESKKDGDTLVIRLLHGDAIEREASYKLNGTDTFHEHSFRYAATFVDESRHFLIAHHGLSPSTLLLGGWRCGTHPEKLEEPLVFTIPRIVCRVNARECRFSVFEGEGCYDVGEDLVTFPYEFTPTVNPRVTRLQEIPECREYVDSLVDLIGELSSEAMDKVVICREVKLTLKSEVSPVFLLRMVAPKRHERYEYVFRWSGAEAWVGISPETLLKKENSKIVVEPLAGTRKGSDSPDKSSRYRQELLSDNKEIEEHETAASMFYENLSTVCIPESIEMLESRSIIDLGYVQHLKSTITGTVKPGMNVFHVLASVYPPATIWGKPIALSGERIRSYEKIERGFFTGGFGFFTLEDDANFALAIRTAKVCGNEVHVYAGGGIVKASDPYREWLETTNKMGPFLVNEFVVVLS